MLSIYLIWTLAYVICLFYLSRHWNRDEPEARTSRFFPSVSLLIPFRNEMENLPNLLSQLKNLTYPKLEIILIDDESEDGSANYVRNTILDQLPIRLLQSKYPGKKSALEMGVAKAKNEIILCSDADCVFPDGWVEEMVLPFEDSAIQLVAGPVEVIEAGGKLLTKFQAIDWSSILLLTNYFFQVKRPLMCSGANLAYRKEAFDQVQGYAGNKEVSSGDDEFLLKKIRADFGSESCVYVSNQDSLVLTGPEESWESLINQRTRWAGKWRSHQSDSHALAAVGSFMVQLIWVSTFMLLIHGMLGLLVLAIVWGIKIGAERLVLGKVLESFNMHLAGFSYLCTSFIHPIYVLCVGVGALVGKFTWKGRGNLRSVKLEVEN